MNNLSDEFSEYSIDICCDLTASTITSHESCENENDGEITLTINGTSNYNVSVNGTLNLNAVSQGNYNIQNLSDGAYALYITDNAFNNCDTSINNSLFTTLLLYEILYL